MAAPNSVLSLSDLLPSSNNAAPAGISPQLILDPTLNPSRGSFGGVAVDAAEEEHVRSYAPAKELQDPTSAPSRGFKELQDVYAPAGKTTDLTYTVSAPSAAFDPPPMLDHRPEASHILVKAAANLPDLVTFIRRQLQDYLVDCTVIPNSPTYDIHCEAQRFGEAITFLVRIFTNSSFSTGEPQQTSSIAYCLEVSRLRGDGMEFNDIFRHIYRSVQSGQFTDASDPGAPDMPTSFQYASSVSFDPTYAAETVACFKSMSQTTDFSMRCQGLGGLADLAMNDNPQLIPILVEHGVPQLFDECLWNEDEDVHRFAIGALASLSLHHDVCRYLIAKRVPRNTLLYLADRLPPELKVPRSIAIVRHSLRLLLNMASIVHRDLIQSCLGEAQAAAACILKENEPEFVDMLATLQKFTGSFGDE
jgi:hypothetical protein